jgi:hypothetical protein
LPIELAPSIVDGRIPVTLGLRDSADRRETIAVRSDEGRNYFSGVTKALGKDYTAGVYGDGIVCKTLLDEDMYAHLVGPGILVLRRNDRVLCQQAMEFGANRNGLA